MESNAIALQQSRLHCVAIKAYSEILPFSPIEVFCGFNMNTQEDMGSIYH